MISKRSLLGRVKYGATPSLLIHSKFAHMLFKLLNIFST